MKKSLLYLNLSALCFLASVAVCILIRPNDLLSHSGLSIFGNYKNTIVPFGAGLAATAYFLIRFSRSLDKVHSEISKSFKLGLEGIAIALLGIIVTPSWSTIELIQDVHVACGLAIFLLSAILSLNYLIRIRGHWFDWFLLVVQLAAIVLAILSFHTIGILSFMLPAQLLAIVAFGALLVRAVRYKFNQTQE